jgi:hypothetical protein
MNRKDSDEQRRRLLSQQGSKSKAPATLTQMLYSMEFAESVSPEMENTPVLSSEANQDQHGLPTVFGLVSGMIVLLIATVVC